MCDVRACQHGNSFVMDGEDALQNLVHGDVNASGVDNTCALVQIPLCIG